MNLSVLRAVLPEDVGDFDPAGVSHRRRDLDGTLRCLFEDRRNIQWACDP
jgi:hypothetical protein